MDDAQMMLTIMLKLERGAERVQPATQWHVACYFRAPSSARAKTSYLIRWHRLPSPTVQDPVNAHLAIRREVDQVGWSTKGSIIPRLRRPRVCKHGVHTRNTVLQTKKFTKPVV